MTKKEFLDDLSHRLKRLPEQERLDALKYYEEYFDEAGIENEQKVISELRSPAHIASKILSEYAEKEALAIMNFASKDYKKADTKERYHVRKDSAKGGFRAVWFTILGIFAAPIAIPLAIAFSAVVIALCIALVALILGLLIGGSALLIAGFVLLFVQPALAILLIGLTLIAIGVTRLLYDAVKWIIKSILQFVRK